jgi:hypothetical protein
MELSRLAHLNLKIRSSLYPLIKRPFIINLPKETKLRPALRKSPEQLTVDHEIIQRSSKHIQRSRLRDRCQNRCLNQRREAARFELLTRVVDGDVEREVWSRLEREVLFHVADFVQVLWDVVKSVRFDLVWEDDEIGVGMNRERTTKGA